MATRNARTAQTSDETTGGTPAETPAVAPQTAEKKVVEVPFAAVEIDDSQFVSRSSNSRAGGGRVRSEYMQTLDALLRDRFESGKVAALECDKDEKSVAALERRINNSAEHTDLGVRFGGYVKSPNEGKVLITFKVVKRTRRPRKTAPQTSAE